MDRFERMPDDRKKKLDSLYDALSIIAEDTHVYICDMRYDYSRWSVSLVDAFGLPGEYMYGAGDIWEEHIHPEDRRVYHEGIDAIFSGRATGHDMQYRAVRKDGKIDICTCRGIVIKDESGQPEYFGGAIRNHSEQSHIDRLTGLRNQYGFFEDIQKHIDNRTPMKVWVTGIGRFAEINEIYGYAAGNTVLQNFGRYLMDHVGNRGGTYRLDGSKFAIITETLKRNDIKKAYEELRAYYRKGIHIENTHVALELNSGMLAVDDFNTDSQTVYTCLDFAYEDSKFNRHGDLIEFRDNLTKDNKQRIQKLHAIRSSVNNDFKGFYLLYQPVVDTITEKVIGAEALLRWRDEKYSMVPPDVFIPLLEKDPIFPELGEWILKTAMEDAKRIQEILPDFVINVNLSYAQLERTDFTDMVWNIIKETGFEPDKLCLEITERCRLLDVGLLRNVMTALRAGGIRIALDDFGTGFSSMGLLKDLPFDMIKIDRSYVINIEDDDRERSLVENITAVAGIYGADVCVEGIETKGMRDILKDFKIHSFQGYLYSKPIEPEAIIARLTTPAGALCFRQ